jgi:glucosylceramidase
MPRSRSGLRYFLTAQGSSDLLTKKRPLSLGDARDAALPSVLIDASVRFQRIEGFGGAFTEAAAVTWLKLSPPNRRRILAAYFDRGSGHGYNLCRTHINSCDFSLGNYACANVPDDWKLEHFSLKRDHRALLPMIREALAISGEPITFFVTPWSPPGWMKTNGQMNRGGKLRPECRQVWADHFVRFIQAYEEQGVPIWGLTVQNEPGVAQTWDSCEYTADEERDFVRDYLGPTLQRAGLGRVKIIIWDHNRDLLVHRARAAYADPEAARYIWGTGFHWYCDDKFENLQLHHDAWPDKHLLFTEGCQEGGPHHGSWAVGERYGRSMIHDFNRWTVGWVDWNLVLDEVGGPNHVGNFCSAPILADTRADTLSFQSSYYYIGHFSRFVRRGSRRILCATTRDNLHATAFINPNGELAVVVMNPTGEEVTFTLDFVARAARAALPAHSIATYILPQDSVPASRELERGPRVPL